MLDTSVGQIKKFTESGQLSVNLNIDIMKYRIKPEHEIIVKIKIFD